MRMILGTILAATALVGCSAPDSVELQHRAQTDTQTRGIALNHEGDLANVGMSGTTCDIVTSYGGVAEDYDYGSGDEVVIDGRTVDGEDHFLVLDPAGGVHLTTPTLLPTQADVVPAAPGGGVVAAQLAHDGFVTVQPVGDECQVAFRAFDGSEQALSTLGVECGPGTEVALAGDGRFAWVATGQGIYQVSDAGVTQVSPLADASVDYDDAAEVLYAAQLGGDMVYGLEAGGFERWATQLDGAITALADMGTSGNAAVSLATSQAGEFIVIDGLTGQVTSDLPTPSAASDLHVSGNGRVLAISLPSSVYYFDINDVE